MKNKMETKLIDFINKPGDSVTIPKNILNECLLQMNDVINSYNKISDKILNMKQIDFFEYILKNDNIEELSEQLHDKYNNDDILRLCVEFVSKLNFINNFYSNLQFLVHDFNFKKSLYEKDLENYLINNLGKIELGMTYINNQVPYIDKEGKVRSSIDILAKDKNNNNCVIELKTTTNDRRLIWQCLTYPSQYKNSRMIVIAPGYSESILKQLNKISNVEKLQYQIEDSDLNSLKIYRI